MGRPISQERMVQVENAYKPRQWKRVPTTMKSVTKVQLSEEREPLNLEIKGPNMMSKGSNQLKRPVTATNYHRSKESRVLATSATDKPKKTT